MVARTRLQYLLTTSAFESNRALSWPLVAAAVLGFCALARGKERGQGGYPRAVRWFPGQIIGIIKILINPDMGSLIREGRKKYGDIYWSQQLDKRVLVLNCPEDWAEVVRQEAKLKLFPDMPDSTRAIHGKGSLQDLPGGSSKHQLYRKIFSALLTPEALQAFSPVLVDHFNRLWKKLEKLSKDLKIGHADDTSTSSNKIMIREHVRDTQFELMAKVLYGLDKANGEKEKQTLEQMRIDFEKEEAALFLPANSQGYQEGLAAAQRNKAFLGERFQGHLRKILDDGLVVASDGAKVRATIGSAMEAVAQALVKNDLHSDGETLHEIVTNLNLLLEASHGTSIYITTSMLYFLHLPENESALQKLRAEVGALPKNPDDASLLSMLKNDMPFADGCINETMRLAPIVEAISYSVDKTQNLTLRQQKLSCPDNILVCLAAPAQDPSYFEQPTEFRPERWVSGDALECPPKSKSALRLMGIGRHVCLGQSLAKVALKAALYSYASNPTRRIEFDPKVTRIKKNLLFPNSLVNDGLMGRIVSEETNCG